ncbi:P-loop containing nucleoside triphosphate hydrol ase [Mycolicibacterium canariasense]|uniref:p-loop containing nucleoside triphosphate hydrol ase n=1 Tax=Mycolicibacterium canariasense TaxID=228230 RepID=A0A124E1Z4_MYCCR|nr:P-loop containing nucleoside triphosphate hydrol ase [Mycolicibacterium canariasense]
MRVCSNGSSGSGAVTRHHIRRTKSAPDPMSSIRMSSSASGSDGAGPGGPVRGRRSGCVGIACRTPCSGPLSGTVKETVPVVSSRPACRLSTRRAAAVRPS